MTDACRGTDPTRAGEHAQHDEAPEGLLDVPTIRAAALCGPLLAYRWGLGRAGRDITGLVATVGALPIGAWTFVPETLQRLLCGRLGVGANRQHAPTS